MRWLASARKFLPWSRKAKRRDDDIVFRYHDGLREREIDPFLALIRCESQTVFRDERHAGFVEKLGGRHPEPHEAERLAETFEEITKAVRFIFDLPSQDDGGLNGMECHLLLHRFEAVARDLTERAKRRHEAALATAE